jgi:outer membrane translocation and assembly module TamA
VANSFPGARLAVFSDAGWAGPRADFRRGKPRVSVGAGVSLLDGLVRFDLAHGLRAPKGWRFDLYFDGRL